MAYCWSSRSRVRAVRGSVQGWCRRGVDTSPASSFPGFLGVLALGSTFVGRRYETVSFLSDYGLVDEFVGVVKAVVRDLAPHVTVVDLTHGVAAFDVRAGALALARCIQYVPSGIVLAVVDPGVGTQRRAVAIEVAGGGGVLVGPDNGLLASAVAMAGGAERAVVLDNPEFHLAAPGATFAGRDVFAPIVAHLCNGRDLTEVGTTIEPGDLLPGVVPLPRDGTDEIVAEIMWIDRYGNAQLNVGPDELEQWPQQVQLVWGDDVRSARRVVAYGDIGQGAIGLVLDSYGMYSISVDRHDAAAQLGLRVGLEVTLRALERPNAVAVSLGVRPQPR